MTEIISSCVNEATYFNIGNLFSGSTEIIQKILNNLSFSDVVSASRLSQTWNYYAKKILNKNRKLRYMTVYPEASPTTEKKVTIDAQLPTNTLLENFMESQPKNIELSLTFVNGDWLHVSNIITKKTPQGVTLLEYLCSTVPEKIDLTVVGGRGIIGSIGHDDQLVKNISTPVSSSVDGNSRITSTKAENIPPDNLCINTCSYCVELEATDDASNPQGFTTLLLPQQNGLTVTKGVVRSSMLEQMEGSSRFKTISNEKFEKILGLDKDEEIKALLVFAAMPGCASPFIRTAISRQNGHVAIGGALVDFVARRSSWDTDDTLAIAFKGPNVRAASIVITRETKTEKEFEKHILELKEHGIPEGNSFAFQIACCGRGMHLYKRFDVLNFTGYNCVESRVFHKHFPHTPIFGIFGDGEYGINYPLPDGDINKRHKKRRRISRNESHQYSTVIVLVGIV